jgi:hypothetical protein
MMVLRMLMLMMLLVCVSLILALGKDLLACYPPALPVFFGEQRLVVPFGGFGRVGHVRVAFWEDLHRSIDWRLLWLFAAGDVLGGSLVESWEGIVKGCFGVDEAVFEDC